MPKDSEQEAEHTTNFISLDLETKASEREAGKDIHLVVGSHNAISTMEVGKKVIRTFQVALVVKNSPINAGDISDVGSIPWSEKFPGGGHGTPLQNSCLENSMDKGSRDRKEMGMTEAI